MNDHVPDILTDETARQPHYHVWTLYQLVIPWPGFSGGWRDTHQMAYIPERTPYVSRSTANNHIPRFDARREYGQKGGRVLACDGGAGCPVYIDPDTGIDIRTQEEGIGN